MKYTLTGIALLSMLALANCGGGDGNGNASCRSEHQRYIDCGIWEGGYTGTCHTQPDTQYATCVSACVADATCGELEDFVCRDDPNTCLRRCENDDFDCTNGRHVAALDQCDGDDDCFDGSDEEGCALSFFRCSEFSPVKIDGGQVCNGQCDCDECIDEAECGEFTCTN
jgi:hypothetical protein